MTDEENEAIEWLKRLVKINKRDNLDDTFEEILLNIIKKQSKEIEDNKKYIDLHYVPYEQYVSKLNELNKKWKDKIKAKIEEVEQWELYNMKIPRLSTLDERLGAKIGIKYVLQSLLEKE